MTMSDVPMISADTETARRNAETVRRFFAEVLSADSKGRLEDFLAGTFVDHDPEPGSDPGRSGVAQKLQGFRTAFPDGQFAPQLIVAAGDMVSVRSLFTGTQTGPMGPMPASGRAVEMLFHDFYRMKEDRICEHWHVFDLAGMLQQLGAG